MKPSQDEDIEYRIEQRFSDAQIQFTSIERRDYPDETIIIVRVAPEDLSKALEIGNSTDQAFSDLGIKGFVTVRPDQAAPSSTQASKLDKGVSDPRALTLANILAARARTSEVQPSLSYIPDAANNISVVTSARHHLIFGRRGAGKTALMAEAKRIIAERGELFVWANLQTHRNEKASTAFLWVALSLCELVQTFFKDRTSAPQVLVAATELHEEIERTIHAHKGSGKLAPHVVPRLRSLLRRFLETSAARLFIFVDDLHYLFRDEQPKFLDLLHGAVRDCDAWLKVAAIKHLSKWFLPDPPTGLQTGHDADHVDLDVTLQNPSDAKDFLEKLLKSYAVHHGISRLTSLFAGEALDRLVLASGAVPRDYMVLCASTIREGRKRAGAKLAGVQDVNKAAGDAAQVKITELEDDAASTKGATSAILDGLNVVRAFCLDTKRSTFFRVDFRDKEEHPLEYLVLQNLMDLRLIHLISPSVSDRHQAGKRAEVFMLDLSQFSGQRLKMHLRVLDFVSGHIVLKTTGAKQPSKVGDTPQRLLSLLRQGPVFALENLVDNERTRPE